MFPWSLVVSQAGISASRLFLLLVAVLVVADIGRWPIV